MAPSSDSAKPLWGWLLAELGVGAAALFATGLLSTEVQHVARIASACAVLAGLVSFAAVFAGFARGTNGLFAGIGAGFFARMLLLAAGLVGSHARGEAALAYAFTFFAVFLVTQSIEIAFVLSRARRSHSADAS